MKLDLQKETKKISDFIKNVLKKTKKSKVVIGISGGIDSTTAFYLLKKAIPLENIIAVHLSYFEEDKDLEIIFKDFPKKNIYISNIKKTVDQILGSNQNDKIRIGNIMARVRMICLYDIAKKNNALVCGTENKSEYYLGYFTKFGDEASDFEPIRHLYKTEVFELAKYLNVPKEVFKKSPTAGLWKDQTDEEELGFSYGEADQVLYQFLEKGKTSEQIFKMGFKNAKKIIKRVRDNEFKHKIPYTLDS